ncbi:unnamed protein product [Cladocopium goreaui]|uniref:Nucleotide-diphospho-sugar transferase domain-containing protein n=1 Tax=Cladocopium goreaui TaxID=2562237 RepID=A0A9P1BLW8_9DINO|nr:unnamed protein product [Cladocopium goreaui]
MRKTPPKRPKRRVEGGPSDERNPAILRSIKEVSRLQSYVEAWQRDEDLLEVPAPVEKLREAAGPRKTLVCTWSGGGSRFARMALNLYESIKQNAPQWAPSFVVLSLDLETQTFLQQHNVTTWLYESVDIFMTRWRLLAALLSLNLNALLLDTDVVFLSDPFPHFFYDSDFEVMTDHFFPERDLWDERWRDEEHVNTGFMFARASERSLQLVQDFIRAHHSPWDAPWDAQGLGHGLGIFDLFDQRIFSHFLRRRLKEGRCFSMMENLTYGSPLSIDGAPNPSVRVHHPSVIAHGGAFFWLHSHRLRGLELPPVAHANFGKNKPYFLRDRGLWFVENLTERFLEPIQHDEYYPTAPVPAVDPWRFLSYHQPHRCGDVNGSLACQFLQLTAALEVAVRLRRRLVLPQDWDCSLLPMWDVYGMSSSFKDKREGCTFDFFADAEAFVKRFGHLLVEAGIRRNVEYQQLSTAQLKDEVAVVSTAILEVGPDVDLLVLRDRLRLKEDTQGGDSLARRLFPCRWVELNLEVLARRPGQAPDPGRRNCGVQGIFLGDFGKAKISALVKSSENSQSQNSHLGVMLKAGVFHRHPLDFPLRLRWERPWAVCPEASSVYIRMILKILLKRKF